MNRFKRYCIETLRDTQDMLCNIKILGVCTYNTTIFVLYSEPYNHRLKYNIICHNLKSYGLFHNLLSEYSPLPPPALTFTSLYSNKISYSFNGILLPIIKRNIL